jgi:chromosome segregation ATPase
LTAKIGELTDEITSLTALLDSANSEKEQYIEQLESVSANVVDPMVLLSKNSDIDRLNENISKLQLEKNNLENLINEQMTESSEAKIVLESKIKEYEIEMNQHLIHLKEKTEKITELESEINDLDELVNELQHNIELMKENESSNVSEIDLLKSQMSGFVSSNAELELELNNSRNCIIELETKCDSLLKECSSLMEDSLNYENSKIELTSYITKISELELHIRELSKNSDMSTYEEHAEQRVKEYQKKYESLLAMVGSKESEISRLLLENDNLTSSLAVLESMDQKNISKENELVDVNEAQSKKINHYQTTIDLLKGEKDSLMAKMNDMESQFKRVKHDFENAEIAYSKKLEENSLTIEKLRSESNNISALWERIRFLESSSMDGKNLLANTTSKYNSAVAEIAELQSKNHTLEMALQQYENSSNKNSQDAIDIDAMQVELTDLRNRYKRAKDECSHVSEELEAALSQLETLTAERKDLEMQKCHLESELVKHEELSNNQNFSALEDQYFQLQNAYDELCADFETEKTNSIEKISQLQNDLNDIIDNASKERTLLTETCDDLKHQIMTLRKELDSVNDASNSNSNDQQLLDELNTLMEQKMEADARVLIAENEIKQLRGQLAEYDQKSAKEIQLVMVAAEKEMESLRASYDSQIVKGTQKLLHLNNTNESLLKENSILREKLEENEYVIEKSQEELNRMKECSQKSDHLERIAQLEKQYCEKESEFRIQNIQFSRLQNDFDNYKSEMKELIETKDRRIEKLDKAKLTQDQLVKFKAIKEENTKKTEECKVLKKQLSQLKKAYEDLGSKSNTVTVDDVRLREALAQAEYNASIANTLKEKLKECSTQLREYETERDSIIQILDVCGFDTSPLTNLDDDANSSTTNEQDLIEIMNKLSVKYQMMTRQLSQTSLLKNATDDQIATLNTELQGLTTEKMALEKRIDSLKAVIALSKDENADLMKEIGNMRVAYKEMEQKYNEAKKSLSASSENISQEIQVLEEENIELMRENKELRIAAANFRSQVDQLSKSKPSVSNTHMISSSDMNIAISDDSQPTKKRFSESPLKNVSNKMTRSEDKEEIVPKETKARAFGDVLSENLLNGDSRDNSGKMGAGQPVENVKSNRRVRAKAKPLVQAIDENGLSTEQSSEKPGECAQS